VGQEKAVCQEKLLALQGACSVKLLLLLMPRDSVLRWLRLLQVPVAAALRRAHTHTHPPTYPHTHPHMRMRQCADGGRQE
jgi:hypothetical protein